MVLRGDWITPTLNGAPYLNKPPLLYWIQNSKFLPIPNPKSDGVWAPGLVMGLPELAPTIQVNPC
jgi:4-amino-4-deoxy-L-arabinose transferase-like glycosyltransferase